MLAWFQLHGWCLIGMLLAFGTGLTFGVAYEARAQRLTMEKLMREHQR